MSEFIRRIWSEDEGQDIAEYAVMLAVILVLVVGTIRLIGSNANNAFSNVASSMQLAEPTGTGKFRIVKVGVFWDDAIFLVYRAVSLLLVYRGSGCGGACGEIESAMID